MSRIVTRQVSELVEIKIDGGAALTGTPMHPIWSVEHQDWVELGQLEVGDHLLTNAGPVEVLSARLFTTGESVYNLEVHGHHIYQVTELGILVHNAGVSKYDAPGGTVLDNAAAGRARELRVHTKLDGHFSNSSVQRERMLRTADGRKAIDPLTGQGRRIDHAVIEGGQARYLVETTSKTADKAAQIAKEARIRANGGTFIRDKLTRELIDVSNVPTRVTRRK